MNDIDYKQIGLKAMQDWHDTEGIGGAENEIIAGLTASIHSITFLPDTSDADFINCTRVVLESAFQLGRAAERNSK